jgi:hypothetical protein
MQKAKVPYSNNNNALNTARQVAPFSAGHLLQLTYSKGKKIANIKQAETKGKTLKHLIT